jgi:phosphatidylinositol alpha-mannosyltransferase
VRVCLITPYDLSHEGGVSRHVQSLARALAGLGHQTRVLGPASGAVPSGCDGLPGVVPVPANGSIARIGLFTRPSATRAYLADGGFDLVHVHEPIVPGPGRHALRFADVPIVATFHANAEREIPLQRVVRWFASARLRRISRAIAVSRQAKRFSRTIYRGRTAVIPNGVDLSRFHPAARATAAGVPGERPLEVLFVGRFGEPRKGLPVLLDAARALRGRGRDVMVRVVGEGPADRFAPEGASAGARFEGRLSDAELAERFASADVFCAPSVGGESFGMVLVEAMAAGCPVVASDIPGYAEAARGAALLFRRGSAAALADVLERVAQDAMLRARSSDRGLARAGTLGWSHVAARVLRIYRQAGVRLPLRAVEAVA